MLDVFVHQVISHAEEDNENVENAAEDEVKEEVK